MPREPKKKDEQPQVEVAPEAVEEPEPQEGEPDTGEIRHLEGCPNPERTESYVQDGPRGSRIRVHRCVSCGAHRSEILVQEVRT